MVTSRGLKENSMDAYAVDLAAAVAAFGAVGHLADILNGVLATRGLDKANLVRAGVVRVTATVSNTLVRHCGEVDFCETVAAEQWSKRAANGMSESDFNRHTAAAHAQV